MNIIITGATGFIGKALSARLIALNHKLIIVSRNPDRACETFDNNGTFLPLRTEDKEYLIPYLNQADAVINIAGENLSSGPWTRKQKQRIKSSRIATTRILVDSIAKTDNKPKVFLQGSAIGLYGNRKEEELTEQNDPGRGFLPDVVKEWEKNAKELQNHPVRLVYLRTGIVLGRDGGILKKLLPVVNNFIGGHFGIGKQWMSWIHLDDEVEAILFLLQNEHLNGAFNLTSPEPVRMKDFVKLFAHSLNRPSWLHIPAFALKSFFGEMAEEVLLTSQKVKPEKLIEGGFTFSYDNINYAFENLLQNK
jgi:uncharacterized protein